MQRTAPIPNAKSRLCEHKRANTDQRRVSDAPFVCDEVLGSGHVDNTDYSWE